MKNFFKKEEEDDGYSEVITKIHKEFKSAGDKLYEQALSIINSSKLLNEEKVKRLQRLGFTASKEVVEAEKIIKERKLNEEVVERIAYYREQYPLQKFITEEQVLVICKKYGLICGRIHQFTGFVPDTKLQLMESFALRERDALHYRRSGWGRDAMPVSFQEYMEVAKSGTPPHASGYYTDKEFQICAPQKDFKLTSKQEVKEYKIVNKPIPDPVVLAPVNGGYLIVAAWGEEASDPLVVNDINN